MGKKNWLKVNPLSGRGNRIIKHISDKNFGRKGRQISITAVSNKTSAVKSYQVRQEASPEFILFDKDEYHIGESSGVIRISGKSNSSKLSLSIGLDNQVPLINLPESIFVDGIEIRNGSLIPGDPGSKGHFNFYFDIQFPANTGGERDASIIIRGGGDYQKHLYILQTRDDVRVTYTKGDHILSVSKDSEMVRYGGTAVCTAALTPNTNEYEYTFDGWYDGGIKVGTDLTLRKSGIEESKNFTAIGSRGIRKYDLFFEITPDRGGTVTGGGRYPYNENVQSTAIPLEGYSFARWENEQGERYLENPMNWNILKDRVIKAIFQIKSYEVETSSFYRIAESGDFTEGDRGGSVTPSLIAEHGSTVILTATPSEGYEFDGWYENSTLTSTEKQLSINITSPRNIQGRFVRKWFTISFLATEGGSVHPTLVRVEYGGSAFSTAIPLQGVEFFRWSNGEKNKLLFVRDIKSDGTYTAQFGAQQYRVRYIGREGIASLTREEEIVEHGKNGVGCAVTLQEGYNFDGWWENDFVQVGTDLFFMPLSVAYDISFTARATLKDVNVVIDEKYCDLDSGDSYNSGTSGGTTIGSGTHKYGSTVLLEATPKDGYEFDGWYNASNSNKVGNDLSLRIENIISDIHYEARFRKRWFSVNLSNSDGIESFIKTTVRVPYNGEGFSESPTPKEGHEFSDWVKTFGSCSFNTIEGNVLKFYLVKSNCTFIANSQRKILNIQYNISNDNFGFLAKNGESVYYGEDGSNDVTIKLNTKEWEYNFEGWFEYPSNEKYSSDTHLTIRNVKRNMHLTARISRSVRNYLVTVRGGKINGDATSAFYPYGTYVTIEVDVPAGKEFVRWDDGSTEISRRILVDGSLNFSAEFRSIKLRLTYERGNGVSSLSRYQEEVDYGEKARGSVASVSYGYVFDGWYLGGQKISGNNFLRVIDVIVSANYVARAALDMLSVWPSPYYTDSDGGNNFSPSTNGGTVSGGGRVARGGSVTVTASPNIGYKFEGWYDNPDKNSAKYSGDLSFTINNIQSEFVIYALFSKMFFDVSYQAGDNIHHTSPISERVGYGLNAKGSTATLNANTSGETYTFDGWYEGVKKVSSNLTYAPVNITKSLSLIAKGLRSVKKFMVRYATGQYISRVSRYSEEVNYGENGLGSTAYPFSDTDEYKYEFDGWYDNRNGFKVWSSQQFSPQRVTSTKNYTAKGKRIKKKYTISSSAKGRYSDGDGMGGMVDLEGTGYGHIIGSGTFEYGTPFTLTFVATDQDTEQAYLEEWYEGEYPGGRRVGTGKTFSGIVKKNVKYTYYFEAYA